MKFTKSVIAANDGAELAVWDVAYDFFQYSISSDYCLSHDSWEIIQIWNAGVVC